MEMKCKVAVDGLHYVAMENLLKHYGGGIRNKRVYLYFNPLWMNSRLYDLSDSKEFGINHPRLLPQFDWNMPSYNAPLAKRMSATLESEKVPMIVLPELPSEEYADASHPLPSGYDRLAEFLRKTVSPTD